MARRRPFRRHAVGRPDYIVVYIDELAQTEGAIRRLPASSVLAGRCHAGSTRGLTQELGPSTHGPDAFLEKVAAPIRFLGLVLERVSEGHLDDFTRKIAALRGPGLERGASESVRYGVDLQAPNGGGHRHVGQLPTIARAREDEVVELALRPCAQEPECRLREPSQMAETVRFELTKGFPPRQFSRLLPSTARPRLHGCFHSRSSPSA